MRYRDITGEVFGELTVLCVVGKKGYIRLWKVKCSCGKKVVRRADSLLYGKSKSCGCTRIPNVIAARKKRAVENPGITCSSAQRRSTYHVWVGMRGRCFNKNDRVFHLYGGRGITVCDRWNKFSNFLEDMGDRPSGLSIERINNNKGYSPSNCKWATAKEQCRNRRVTKWVTLNGEKITLAEVAEKYGIPIWRIRYKLKCGIDIHIALGLSLKERKNGETALVSPSPLS